LLTSSFAVHDGLCRATLRDVRTELVKTEDQDGLVDLEAKDLGLDKGKRLSVDLDETLTSLYILRKYPVSNARALVAVEMYLAVGDS
jgi:hypothetical protein